MEQELKPFRQIHAIIHFAALCSVAVGLVFGKAILSIALFTGLLNLIVLADYKQYWSVVRSYRLIHILLAYYFFHIISLLWSTDLEYGLHDTKVRTSLLLLVLLFSLQKLTSKEYERIAWVFVLSVLLATFFNFLSYVGLIGNRPYDDIRGMSHFGSHIRFALLVVTGILLSLYLISQNKRFSLLLIPVIVWLIYYTYYSQVVSGYLTLVGLISFILFIWTWRKNKWVSIGILSFQILIGAGILLALFRPIPIDKEKYKDLPAFTKEGNPYYHKPVNVLPETGEAIEIMICWDELEREWNKVSAIPFRDGRDMRGQLIQTTLIRYLASMGLPKDAEGISKLNKKDIVQIEKGNASVHYKGLLARWYSIQYQLNNYSDPNGHSLLERLEYWKHGIAIAKDHVFSGTGIGDVQLEFDRSYQESRSQLLPERRNRGHNMILTTLISMGVIGLFLFIWFHAHFLRKTIVEKNIYAVGFMIILIISYFTEDTLETQTGVSFAGFFMGYFYNQINRSESNEGLIS